MEWDRHHGCSVRVRKATSCCDLKPSWRSKVKVVAAPHAFPDCQNPQLVSRETAVTIPPVSAAAGITTGPLARIALQPGAKWFHVKCSDLKADSIGNCRSFCRGRFSAGSEDGQTGKSFSTQRGG